VIVVDKPEGWTSHDVVAKMRGIARTKRIGHLGTLDPIATGVLPLVIEKATRLAQFYTRSDKLYEGVVRFGWATNTYDREGTVTGEWTPDYFGLPWAPLLLKGAAPDVRLLLLLRDPVERFRSGLAHRRRMGESTGPSAVNDAIQRGYYHRLLADWLAHFDRSQLLILQYERCVADPAGQLRATFRFLGLADSDLPHPAAVQPGAPRAIVPESPGALDPTVRRRLVSLYSSDVSNLARMLPAIDLGLWPNFAHLAEGPADPDDGSNSPSRRP